ncbi:MAG TPA: hypothetical protein VGE04_16415 [Chloroflexia bacterium]|jgi:hypothetical protein
MIAPLFRMPALSALSITLLLVLSACGPAAATVPGKQPTNTPVSAQVPKQPEAATPSPHSTYPAATDEDIQLIKKALANSSAANLKRLHFVSTTTITGWHTTVTEGDVIAPEGQYMKVTQGASVEETLVLGNTSYCKDSSGKWIVEVADLQAQRAQILATMQAERGNLGGFPEVEGTLVPNATVVTYDYDASTDLPAYGSVDADAYDFSYAGKDTVEGVPTRRYIGEEDWLGAFMTPDATAVTVTDAGKKEEARTLSLWIDADAGADASYVRKLEYTFYFSPMWGVNFGFMDYGCGEVPPDGPTPTMPPFPEGTWTTTVVYSRLNDPTLALPTP